jgi:hypothetical protein
VIEILSDSEPEALDVEDEAPESAPNTEDANEQPLLKAAGIKYKIDKSEEEEPQQEPQGSPSSAKLAVRTRDTGSVKHRHVSIEIPLPTSTELRRKTAEGSESQDGNEEEVFKTPSERRHITFDDSDNGEFVTPREAPSRDPLESSIPKPAGKDEEEDEEEEEDSDDEAPEAVSTRAAEADTLKASEAAAKAAEQ